MKVLIKKLDNKVKLPEYKTTGSSGLDLTAFIEKKIVIKPCLLYTSPSPRDREKSRMPSSA